MKYHGDMMIYDNNVMMMELPVEENSEEVGRVALGVGGGLQWAQRHVGIKP